MKTYNMSEEIKQKAREELKELFPLEYLRDEIDNFGYASLENWIDDILSQALQKRDEEILGLFIGEMKMELQKRLSTLTTK